MEIPEEIVAKAAKLQVNLEDIDEQFVRGSGAGGQKINKTNSCVLLTHRPSGIVVRCQKHRERERNRLSAFKLLLTKIEEVKLGNQSSEAKRKYKIHKQKERRHRKSKERMLKEKAHRSEKKQLRKGSFD